MSESKGTIKIKLVRSPICTPEKHKLDVFRAIVGAILGQILAFITLIVLIRARQARGIAAQWIAVDVAAAVGMKKYGKEKMEKMAKAGRKKK